MSDLPQGMIRARGDAALGRAFAYGVPGTPSGRAEFALSVNDATRAATNEFIDEIYAAAVEFERLPHALALFARAFDAREAFLFTKDAVAGADKIKIVERAASAGVHAAHNGNGLPPAAGLGVVQELGAELARGSSEVHLGYTRDPVADIQARRARSVRTGTVHYLAIAADAGGKAPFGVAALRRDIPFSEADRQRAQTLVLDIRRALELRQRAGRAETFGLGVQMFEKNPIAILITRQRSIEKRNPAAAALMADGRPVSLSAGKLRFDDSRAHSAFELISRAEVQSDGNQAFAFVVEGAGGRTWIAQFSLARSLSRLSYADAASPAVVVIALTPFNTASQTREAMLNGFTDLTPTERTIFAAFVDGLDISAIARRLDRSVETIRWHVRNLFTKLGVNSQADLARLGALLLPI